MRYEDFFYDYCAYKKRLEEEHRKHIPNRPKPFIYQRSYRSFYEMSVGFNIFVSFAFYIFYWVALISRSAKSMIEYGIFVLAVVLNYFVSLSLKKKIRLNDSSNPKQPYWITLNRIRYFILSPVFIPYTIIRVSNYVYGIVDYSNDNISINGREVSIEYIVRMFLLILLLLWIGAGIYLVNVFRKNIAFKKLIKKQNIIDSQYAEYSGMSIMPVTKEVVVAKRYDGLLPAILIVLGISVFSVILEIIISMIG